MYCIQREGTINDITYTYTLFPSLSRGEKRSSVDKYIHETVTFYDLSPRATNIADIKALLEEKEEAGGSFSAFKKRDG